MKALLRSQRGAIMVVGLFMAIFATGCLYYLVGLGDAIAQRERMQDAADAAAFSAAALHARGMNVIALINMTMAALLAVLIALKLVEMIAYLGVLMATGLAFFTQGLSLPPVPGLTTLAINARLAHEEALPVVQASLRTLHVAARGVRIVMPWVAQARTVEMVVDHYNPPASFGFEVPGTITLPTRDGSYDDLCRKAGEYVGALVDESLLQIHTVGFRFSDITGGLVDAGSAWFCETDGAEPPGRRVRREIDHPVLPRAQACADYANAAHPNEQEHDRICAEAFAETEAADAAIDPVTGQCVYGADSVECGPDGSYEQRASAAQQACAPRTDRDGQWFDHFTWQAHVFKRRYALVNSRWEVETPLVAGSERYELRKETLRPCGTSTAQDDTEWRLERWRDHELAPICEHVSPFTPQNWFDGTAEIVHTEVLQIFGCVEHFSERRELGSGGGELSANGDGSDMAPQLIAEGTVLGAEPFQIRAVVVGERSYAAPEPLLRSLQSDEAEANGDETALWKAATELGRVSVAQAEFYFDARDPRPSDLLWSMGWTARLRPFRLAEAEPAARSTDDVADAARHGADEVRSTFEAACSWVAGDDELCGSLDLSMISDLIAH